jgi:hypothetical protein
MQTVKWFHSVMLKIYAISLHGNLLYTTTVVTLRCLIWIFKISTTGRDMEKLSVSYSTMSRILLNKTITKIPKTLFHKHFKMDLGYPCFINWQLPDTLYCSLGIQIYSLDENSIEWRKWKRSNVIIFNLYRSRRYCRQPKLICHVEKKQLQNSAYL